MEERYHATTQNRFYPDMSNVNKTIIVEAKLISPPTYLAINPSVWFMFENWSLALTKYILVAFERKEEKA